MKREGLSACSVEPSTRDPVQRQTLEDLQDHSSRGTDGGVSAAGSE